MFFPCPHCQFLVACPPQSRALLPADCPRCGRPLSVETGSAAGDAPADTGASGSGLLAPGAFAAAAQDRPAQTTAVIDSGGSPQQSSAQAASLRALGADTGNADAEPAGDAPSAGPAVPVTTADASFAEPDAEPERGDALPEGMPGELETATQAAQGAHPDRAGAEAGATAMEANGHATPAAESSAEVAPAAPPAAFAPRERRRGWSRLRWPLVALLVLLLGLQIVVADRARLAADPAWRPLAESLCGALGCELPPWHEPTAFIMLDRQVRPAAQAGALRVDATFRNDARWTQDWPALQLALSDADGRVIGSRAFVPAEYLGAAPTTQLSPGQTAQISFLVREPAAGTVAFSFDFR